MGLLGTSPARRHAWLLVATAAGTLLLALVAPPQLTELDWLKELDMLFWRNVQPFGKPTFDTSELQWAASLRAAMPEIRDEFHAMEALLGAQAHGDEPRPEFVQHWSGREGWTQLMMMGAGVMDWEVARRMPATFNAVFGLGVPLLSVWFSVLQPNTTLSLHKGEFKGVQRYHLSIEVPPPEAPAPLPIFKQATINAEVGRMLPPRFRPDSGTPSAPLCEINRSILKKSHAFVGVVSHESGMLNRYGDRCDLLHYADGGDMMFDDNYMHFVANTAYHHRRVVLFADVVRNDVPLPLALLNRFLCWYVSPAVGEDATHEAQTPMANQAAHFRSIGLPSDVAPWFARGFFLYAHIALATFVFAAGVGLARRPRKATTGDAVTLGPLVG